MAFIQFDIGNFYSSITMELLYKSIQFEKEITWISEEDLDIIMKSRKPLFHNQELLVKRIRDEDFGVSMGCCHGAEIWELVSSYFLNKSSNISDKESVGLDRDDGQVIKQNISGKLLWKYSKIVVFEQ